MYIQSLDPESLIRPLAVTVHDRNFTIRFVTDCNYSTPEVAFVMCEK